MRTLKLKAQPTNAFNATLSQSNVRLLLPASNHSRARGNQIVVHSSNSEPVFGSSRKLGGAAKELIDGGEKRICRAEL